VLIRGAALALIAIGLAGCGASSDSSAPADRCVERMMARVDELHPDLKHRAEAESYARSTYCDRFARNGWVYPDGTLSIDAQEWLVEGRTCGTSENGKMRTVPCEQLDAGSTTMDCAMLHFVRRSDVQEYLRHVGASRCDDGTPFDALGA
jgi:hypothetical protein